MMVLYTLMIMFLLLVDLCIFCIDLVEHRLALINIIGCCSCIIYTFFSFAPAIWAILGLMTYQLVFFEMKGDQFIMQVLKMVATYYLGNGLIIQTYTLISLLVSYHKLVRNNEY